MDPKKLLPSIIAMLVMASGTFAEPVQAYVTAHPIVATLIAGVATILANFAPQPHK